MARDGSGDYSRVVTPPSNGDVADADDYNAEINDIASALSDSINKAGTKAFAANQPMGGFKFTGLGAGSSNGDSVRYEQLASSIAAAVGVSVQAYDATLTALAALSWSSGSPLVQFTAADTVSLTLTPSVTSVTVGLGAAGTPSITFSGDTNTGIFSPTADRMAFTAGGTSRMIVFTGGVFMNSGQFQALDGTVSAPGLTVVAEPSSGLYRIGTNNWGFALGGTKYVDLSTTLAQFVAPVQAPLAVSSETSGTLTVASANKQVNASGGVTINDGVFAANDWVFIENSSGSAITITADTGMTLRLHGTATTGNRTLAVYGGAAIRFKTNSDAIVYGDVT